MLAWLFFIQLRINKLDKDEQINSYSCPYFPYYR
jgi:hypothetical protein